MPRRGGAARNPKARTKSKPKRVVEKRAPQKRVSSARTDNALAAPAPLVAFSVHIFTALGAGCAMLALLAAVRSDWTMMFAWLGLALLIDGVDGTFARRFQVAKILPRWSGDALDLIVDFTTYVFVPAYALVASGMLPQPAAIPLGIAIVVSAAIYCADRDMKLPDNSFRGFPVLWNALAFHLFVLKFLPWVSAGIVALFVILTFAPYRTIHPLRVPQMHATNIAALGLWSALAFYALLCGLNPPLWAVVALTVAGAYILGAGLTFSSKPER